MNPQSVAVSYGALELKRAYQHNLLLGVLIAAGLHLAAVGSVLIYRAHRAEVPPIPISLPPDKGVIDVGLVPLPPPVDLPHPGTQRADALLREEIGTPVAVPDEDVTEPVVIPTRLDLALLNAGDPGLVGENTIGSTDSIVADADEEYFPELGEFVATEEMPVCVYPEPPIYPELARLTQQAGSVKVAALVDLDGTVAKVMIVKSSGSNVGFDEAALAAVAKNRYKPAIQNGRPVRVWVTHQVDFSLK